MRGQRTWSAASAATLLNLVAASACSSNPPPEVPEAPLVAAEPDPPADAAHNDAPDMAGEPAAPAQTATNDKQPSIPDNYEITAGDCSMLGNQLGAVTRSDELAKLSPKLKDKQRDQAEKSVEQMSSKLADTWTQTCMKTLVGKSADPNSLKCALDSKTAKAFDVCINGEDSTARK